LKRSLRKGSHPFEILDRYEAEPDRSSGAFRDEFITLRFLQDFRRDPFSMMSFRNILSKGVHGTGVSALSDDDVLEEIAKRIKIGQLRVNRLPMPGSGAVSTQPAPEEEPEGEAAAHEEVEHWIKLQIVDEQTGEPVEGVALKIKLPTGEVKQFTTDRTGTIEVNGIPEGSCDIEEMIDSDALEVVEVV
jgi:hypothetical protein